MFCGFYVLIALFIVKKDQILYLKYTKIQQFLQMQQLTLCFVNVDCSSRARNQLCLKTEHKRFIHYVP